MKKNKGTMSPIWIFIFRLQIHLENLAKFHGVLRAALWSDGSLSKMQYVFITTSQLELHLDYMCVPGKYGKQFFILNWCIFIN